MTSRDWRSALRITPTTTRLLVTTEQGDVLKAHFEPSPAHPRALLTLLEGLSLWQGRPPLPVALSVDARCRHGLGSMHFDDELWLGESPLVHFEFVVPVRRKALLRGLGDFRAERDAAVWRRA